MSVKLSLNTQESDNITAPENASKAERKKFLKEVGLFFLLFVIIYLYFMLADLSSAPKFIYAQF